MRGGNDRDCCAGVLRGWSRWSRWSWFVGYAASIWIAGDICASVALSTTMTIRDIRISYLARSSWVLLVSSRVWEDEKMMTYYEHDDVNFFVQGTAMMFANRTKEISDNTATLISSATWPKRCLYISGRGSTSYLLISKQNQIMGVHLITFLITQLALWHPSVKGSIPFCPGVFGHFGRSFITSSRYLEDPLASRSSLAILMVDWWLFGGLNDGGFLSQMNSFSNLGWKQSKWLDWLEDWFYFFAIRGSEDLDWYADTEYKSQQTPRYINNDPTQKL